MKNITQTILLGLALCCLIVSNGFGQITEWQELKVRQTLTRYCELMTRFVSNEDAEAAGAFKKLFISDKVMVYNDLNKDEPYTELRFYLRDVEKKRTKDMQLTFTISGSTAKLNTLHTVMKPDEKFIEAVLWQQMKVENNTTKTYEVKVLINIGNGKIVNTFNDEILSVDEANLPKETLLAIALKMLDNKEYDKSLQRLLRLAKKGHALSMYFLGEVYLKNYDDVQQAVIWFKKSVDKGEPASMYSLASLYGNLYHGLYEGKGLDKNPVKALELYRKSAQKHYASAYYALGRMYQIGELVPQNDSIAFKIYEQGVINSSEKLDKSVQYCKYSLANMYINGVYVSKDLQKAFKLYLECAESGTVQCMHNLAICYLNGEGTEVNKAEAERWLLEAAQNGYVESQRSLGEYYMKSRTHENIYYYHEGIKWLEKVAATGNEEVKNFLKSITRPIIEEDKKIEKLFTESKQLLLTKDECEEIGIYYFERKNYQYALKAMELALQKGSEKKGTYFLLTVCAFLGGDMLKLDYYSAEGIKTVEKEILLLKMNDSLYIDNIYSKIDYMKFRYVVAAKTDRNMELGLAKTYAEQIIKFTQDIKKNKELYAALCKKSFDINPTQAKKHIDDDIKGGVAHTYLAKYYAKNKNIKKAIFHYEKFLEITPEDQEAKQALEALKK